MTEKTAQEFRTKGAALARAKTEGFGGVYFGLSTTLGTRIRCEVSGSSYCLIRDQLGDNMIMADPERFVQKSQFKGSWG